MEFVIVLIFTDLKDEKWKVIRKHSLQVTTIMSKVTAKIPIVTTKQKIITMRPNVTETTSNFITTSIDVTTMTLNFTKMSSNVTAMTSDITKVMSNVTTMTSDVTTMKSNFTTTTSNVTKIMPNVTKMMHNVTKMSNVTTKTQKVSVMQNITTRRPTVTRTGPKIAKEKTKMTQKKHRIIAKLRMLYGDILKDTKKTMTSVKPSFKHDVLDSLKQKAGKQENVSKYVFEIMKAPEVAHDGQNVEAGHLGKFIVVVKKEEIDPVQTVSDSSLGKEMSTSRTTRTIPSDSQKRNFSLWRENLRSRFEKAKLYLSSTKEPHIELKKDAAQQLLIKKEIENEREILLDRIQNSGIKELLSTRRSLGMGFEGYEENPNAQSENPTSEWLPRPTNKGLDGIYLPDASNKSLDGKSRGLQNGTSLMEHDVVQALFHPSGNSSLKLPKQNANADQSNLAQNQGPQEAAIKRPNSIEPGMLNSSMTSSYLKNDAKGLVRGEKSNQDERTEDKRKMEKHVSRVKFREKADAAKAVETNKVKLQVLDMNNRNAIEMHRHRRYKNIADKNVVRNKADFVTDDEISFKRRKKHANAFKKIRAFPEKQFNSKIMIQAKHNKRKLAKKENYRKRRNHKSKTHNFIYGENYYHENDEKHHTKRDNVNGNFNGGSNDFKISLHGRKQKLGERKLKSEVVKIRKLKNKGDILRDKKYLLHHHRHLGNKQWLSERHWDKSLLEIGKHDSGHLNRFQKRKIGHKVNKNEQRKLEKLRREITKRTKSFPDQVLRRKRQKQDRNKTRFSASRQSLKRFRKDKAETKGHKWNFYQNRQKKQNAKHAMRKLLKKFRKDKAETKVSKRKFDQSHSHGLDDEKDYLKKKLSKMYKVAVQKVMHKKDLLRLREKSNRQYRDQNSSASKVAVYNVIDKPLKRDESTVEHIPALERSELFCANKSCPLTIVKTLGFPTIEFSQAKEIIAVVRHGLFTPLPSSIMNLNNNLHKKQKQPGPISCKKIKQKEKQLNGLKNWRICYFKGPLSGRMMDMIRNNHFIIVTRRIKGQMEKLIVVQKDDERVTREIIRRIIEGEARRKRVRLLTKCPLDSCKNGGTCQHLANGTKVCLCENGFAGAYCEYNVKVCYPGSARCYNNGSCHLKSDGATYGCSCEPGYSGTLCQQRLRQCSGKILNCLNGGTCVEDEAARCLCTSQFTGTSCESKQIILCATNPCHSSSLSCFDKASGFICTCPPERKGERCELNADLCPANPSPCKNSGICVPSTNNSHTCICDASHYGPSCESTFVDCGANDLCLNGGTCFVPHADKSTVVSSRTQDYHCICPSGYSGDQCETRVDVCLKSMPCQNGGDCKMADNMLGFICVCKAPYQGDHCEQAASGPVSRTLLVLGGKKGTCEKNHCQNGGSCYKSTDGRDVCICLRGFGGILCENWQDVCMSGPCLNGGTCYNLGNGQFKCTCLDGYTGFNCQRVQSACTPTTCQNNGVCRPSKVESGYVCLCAEGYGGISCDVHDPCLSHPCQNGGGCKIYSEGTKFQCDCPTGFTGILCQNKNITMNMMDSGNSLGPCFSVPCLHGGTCKETVNRSSYECICLPGVKGRLCEKDSKDECKSMPCLNGAVCKNLPGKFECHCPYGLEGITCEKKLFIDPCDQKPCQNGGLCKVINV